MSSCPHAVAMASTSLTADSSDQLDIFERQMGQLAASNCIKYGWIIENTAAIAV